MAETGLPGRPSTRLPGESPKHQRLPRPHCDPPEIEGYAARSQRLLHEVMVADRRSAERHDDVGGKLACLADRGRDRLLAVRHNAEVTGLASGGAHQPGNPDRIRGSDLVRRGLGPRRHEFVARRNDCNAGQPADRHRAVSHRRGE